MATFDLIGPPQFPNGTSVAAYPRSNWNGPVDVTAAPVGAAAETKTVTGGVASFTTLASETRYVAYALVGGQHRYKSFAVRTSLTVAAATASARIDDAGGNLGTSYILDFAGATDVEVRNVILNQPSATITLHGLDPTKVQRAEIIGRHDGTGTTHALQFDDGTGAQPVTLQQGANVWWRVQVVWNGLKAYYIAGDSTGATQTDLNNLETELRADLVPFTDPSVTNDRIPKGPAAGVGIKTGATFPDKVDLDIPGIKERCELERWVPGPYRYATRFLDVEEAAQHLDFTNAAYVLDGATITATRTSGSSSLTSVVTVTGTVVNGQRITGTGIPAGATVVSGAGTATLVLSANATSSGAGSTYTVGNGASNAIQFAAATTFTADRTSGSTQLTNVTGGTPIVGMPITTTSGIPSLTFVKAFSGTTVTMSAAATSTAAGVTVTQGGETVAAMVMSKRVLRHCEVRARFRHDASSALSSSFFSTLAAVSGIGAVNRLEAKKSNAAVPGLTEQIVSVAGTNGTGSVTLTDFETTHGVTWWLAMRRVEDLFLAKAWKTYQNWRGAHSTTAAYAPGDGVLYTPAGGDQGHAYVARVAIAAGTNPTPDVDNANWDSCEEPDWQIVRRITPSAGGLSGVSTSLDPPDTGTAGFWSVRLTGYLAGLQITELVKKPDTNIIAYNTTHPIDSIDGVPVGWNTESTNPRGTFSTAFGVANAEMVFTAIGYGDKTNGATITLVNPAAANRRLAVTVVGRAVTVSLATNGASALVSTADQVIQAVNTDRYARAVMSAARAGGNNGSGVVPALAVQTLTGGSGMSLYLEDADDPWGETRKAFAINADVGENNVFWTYNVFADNQLGFGGVNPRLHVYPQMRVPRYLEFSIWSRGENIVDTKPGTPLGLVIVMYRYDRETAISVPGDEGHGTSLKTYYDSLGPDPDVNHGQGTWDWHWSRWTMFLPDHQRIRQFNYSVGFHNGLTVTGKALFLYPEIRAVY